MDISKILQTINQLTEHLDPNLSGEKYRELLGLSNEALIRLASFDSGCQAEQAAAWHAVFKALNTHFPNWHDLHKTGMGAAVEAIKQMAERNPSSVEKCTDPIVEQNVSLLRERSTVGVQKYGTTLADNKLTHKQWLRHALEELLDGANYLQAALQQGDEQPEHKCPKQTAYGPGTCGKCLEEQTTPLKDLGEEAFDPLLDMVGNRPTDAQCKYDHDHTIDRVNVQRKILDMVDEMPCCVGPVVPPTNAQCKLPPFGWDCTRAAGHEGPCAAVPWSEDKYKAEWAKIAIAIR